MKAEIKYALYLIFLGASLVVYAHANFATKSTVEKMDDRIYEIWKEVVKKEKP
jgi:hypothetical protein